jgi:hypothetical protein
VQLLPKASDELRPSIENDHLQNSMQAQHMSNADLSILLSSVLCVDGYEASRFGGSVNDHPNRVKLAGISKLQCGSALTSMTRQNR